MTDSEKLDLILSEMQGMKSEMQELKRRTTNIELHLENNTDKNIQLIAENFIELTKKSIKRFRRPIKILLMKSKSIILQVKWKNSSRKLQNLKTRQHKA